jgi:hypothetical protein
VTRIETVLVIVAFTESLSVIVNVVGAISCVGVPLKTAVEVLKDKPVGSAGEMVNA